MKNVEAFREIARLSTETQANIFGTTNYKEIDSQLEKIFSIKLAIYPKGLLPIVKTGNRLLQKLKAERKDFTP